MDIDDEKILYAVEHTEILSPPKQHLSTFGTTNLYYYLITEPAYSDIVKNATETVIREGRVIAEKPKIVTPYYLFHLEGFGSEARRYLEVLMQRHGPHVPGLFYSYKNEPKQLNIVSDSFLSVLDKLNQEIDQREDPLATIIKGVDEFWDVSLLKFIYEVTKNSLQGNIGQMGARGLLNMGASGVPAAVRMAIDELFQQVSRGERAPKELKEELDRWGLFYLYEDKFLSLFQKR